MDNNITTFSLVGFEPGSSFSAAGAMSSAPRRRARAPVSELYESGISSIQIVAAAAVWQTIEAL
jgi:hypothetical protein